MMAAALMTAASMMAQAVPSNELFATYQVKDVTMTLENHTDPQQLGIDCYIATCGQTMMMRAISNGESKFGDAGWATQLRVETGGRREIQACTVVNNKDHYTGAGCNHENQLLTTAENLEIHFFVAGEHPAGIAGGYRITDNFAFNRKSINTPIEDAVAPILNAENTTIVDNGADITITFGAVTADDQYFYYVGDKEHNLGTISFDNVITLAKPAAKNGISYTIRAYAVDFNGNMSEDYKEYSFTLDFDKDLNLALTGTPSEGIHQDANECGRAIDGNGDTFWTSFNTGEETDWWWAIDLGEVYDVNRVRILFNDNWGTDEIKSSLDGEIWADYISGITNAEGADQEFTKTTQARYFKVISSVSQIGIKEFEVYATGVSKIETTVEAVETLSTTTKVIRNGQLIIVRDGVEYNAMGAQL